MLRSLVSIFFCLTLTGVASAASDDVIVRMLVGDDVTPPSVAAVTSVVPVTQNQIDITWSTSTDDILLGGYSVVRDGVAIATTTLTSYSDTGLSSGTTYSYAVRAFDSSINYATTSAAVATTTLVAVATSTPDTSVSRGSRSTSDDDFSLLDFSLTPHQDAATLEWTTNAYTTFVLRWGNTSSYELGSVSSDVFRRTGSTYITGLQAGTRYFYDLIALDDKGAEYQISQGVFVTTSAPDISPPPNVFDLRAQSLETAARLTWQNPEVVDFSHVRVVRNPLFYPLDPQDGFIVYDGSGTSFVDSSSFTLHDKQFYTVFSYDESGNVSSGAVIVSTKEPQTVTDLNTEQSTTTDSTYSLDEVTITVIQDSIAAHDESGVYTVNSTAPVTISIPRDQLPEHLKTITITLYPVADTDSTFTFLLRTNADKTAYEATVSEFSIVGAFTMVVKVYDFKTQVVSEITKLINSESNVLPTAKKVTYWWFWWPLLILLFLLWRLHRWWFA